MGGYFSVYYKIITPKILLFICAKILMTGNIKKSFCLVLPFKSYYLD